VDKALDILATQYGLPGVIIVILLVALWKKDKQVAAIQQARIEQAEAGTKLVIALQSTLIDSVKKLGDIFEDFKEQRRMSGRGGGPR
jgi:hypothetical protein